MVDAVMSSPRSASSDAVSALTVLGFPDGRECVPRTVTCNSDILKGLACDQESEHASVGPLPRQLFQVWVQHCLHSHALDTASSDEERVCMLKVLDSLTDDQCLRVLRTRPLPQLLTSLPNQYHLRAIMAHHSTIESSCSLDLGVSEPGGTGEIVTKCLEQCTALTSLAFRPWLRPKATAEAFRVIQSLPLLVALDLSGMHLKIQTVKVLREVLPSMPSLRALTMAKCGISRFAMSGIVKSLTTLTNLEELSLPENPLYFEGCLILAQHFSLLQTLTKLNLSHTWLCERATDCEMYRSIQQRDEGEAILAIDFLIELCSLTAIRRVELRKCLGAFSHMEHQIPGFLENLAQLTYLSSDVNHLVEFVGAPNGDAANEGGGGLQLRYEQAMPWHHELDIEIASREAVRAPPDPLPGMKPVPHVTGLRLSFTSIGSQAAELAEGLASMSGLKQMMCDCTALRGGSEGRVLLHPFAAGLSNFQALTGLAWHDSGIPEGNGSYLEDLATALQHMPSLQDLFLEIRLEVIEGGVLTRLATSLAALTALTSLMINSPTISFLDTLMPLLPPATLRHLAVSAPKSALLPREYKSLLGTSAPVEHHTLHAVAMHCARLTGLQSLCVRCPAVLWQEVADLASSLPQLTALTEMALLLNSPRQEPASQGPTAADNQHSSQFFRALRGLPRLEMLSLEGEMWLTQRAMEECFTPAQGGLGPDPAWRSLKDVALTTVPGNHMPRGGKMLSLALCAAENIESVICRTWELTPACVAPLLSRRCFWNLRNLELGALMHHGAAAALGRALSGLALPCLRHLSITALHPDAVMLQRPPDFQDGNECSGQDVALRSVVQGLAHAQLPSLETLLLTGSKDHDFVEPGAKRAWNARGREMGTSLALILNACTRLQDLKLASEDLSPACIKLLAPSLGALWSLTCLHLTAAEFGDDGAGALITHATKLTALREIQLLGCAVHDSCFSDLAGWLQQLVELHEMSFKGSKFGPISRGRAFHEIQSTKRLQGVLMDDCTVYFELAG